mgnify:FL=1
MDFNSNKSIYLQICDSIYERILCGELQPDERIQSVREYAAVIGVNPNTIMRSYEKLTSEGVIYNRRGIGYFTAADAKERVLEAQKKQFLEEELPMVIRRMNLLGINEEDLIKAFHQTHATA